MGILDIPYGRPHAEAATRPSAIKRQDMEHIRRIFDEDMTGKKFCSIVSPRVDAMMFRSTERPSVPCECVVELYELLWRWGHQNTEYTSFVKTYGFAIPDTIIIVKGKPYAWYFISKKDGSLLRKSEGSLSLGAVEKKLCREPPEGEMPICATWYPMASQFPEARCHSQMAEFLTAGSCRDFLANLRSTHSGIIQSFVEPHGVSNFLVRTVTTGAQYQRQTSLSVRTNRAVLNGGRGNFFDRCATFEGWEGLSSSCSRYRSHRHPHMEDLMLEAGQALNQRIEQECVRQMLFLEPTQHVALHFKVTRDNMLFFIYASVVSEKEVILQTRQQLLMHDECMTEDMPCQALLTGGTTRKAVPFEPPSCVVRRAQQDAEAQRQTRPPDRSAWEIVPAGEGGDGCGGGSLRSGSLPPIAVRPREASRPQSGRDSGRQRSLSARRHWKERTILPMMPCDMPAIPDAPFHITDGAPPPAGDIRALKRPLARPNPMALLSEQPLSARPPLPSLSARSATGRSALADGGSEYYGGEPLS